VISLVQHYEVGSASLGLASSLGSLRPAQQAIIKSNAGSISRAWFRADVTVRDVAAQLGITKSSAGRLRVKAREDGLPDAADGDGDEDDGGTVH
jgi:hypothetical protein